MSTNIERVGTPPSPQEVGGDGLGEKRAFNTQMEDLPLDDHVEADLNVSESELVEAKEIASRMTLDEVQALMKKVIILHEGDPNFPHLILSKIREFLGNEHVFEHPEKHEDLIYEMKVEAALITNNSPYMEVRSVVPNTDDPSTPVSTIRSWVIGLAFSVLLAFINQLFSIRQPPITVMANVAQLLAFPVGKLWEKTMPDVGFTLFGTRHSLNPGPFNKKEHMLITIMANVAYHQPYTSYIIWVQYLPQYFNQSFAGRFSYQILVALGTNFVGYGMAGLARRFLVYPSHCVWPASLVTIALNQAFHNDKNNPVQGPLKKIWAMTRLKFFVLAFGAMFVYFWFPQFIFNALAYFSWMTWIAPDNVNLSAVTGSLNGMGINPIPTFDWNVLLFDNTDPLMIPFFSTLMKFIGTSIATITAFGLWYTNAYFTGYLPINSNHVFDNTGALYNVSRAVDDRGILDPEEYRAYSPAYMAAGNLTAYMFFFAVYPATLIYIYLNHRYEVWQGMKSFVRGFRKDKSKDELEYDDVHMRLMRVYPEVSEWWYLAVLVCAIAFGVAGISGFETYTTPGVVFYGIILCLIFVVPVGIVKSMTGIEVTLNVLAEFIGGSWVAGNALAMNYFKAFGYVTCAHAIWFSNDLKLAHYIKLPPRHTFSAQMVATLVSTFVCTGVLNFQLNQIPGVCTVSAPNHFTCPGNNTFFTASVLWGTLGPPKIFGPNGTYTSLLVGFPIGVIVPLVLHYVKKRFSHQAWARQIHPVAILYGALTLAPYNLSYIWPAVPVAWFSWIYIKNRYMGLWSKYNFVLSAAFSSGIAIAAIIIFFSLQWAEVSLDWWGNSVVYEGCEGTACTRLKLAEGEHFGPGVGDFS